MNENKRKELSVEIQQAVENQEWENLEVSLREAQEVDDFNYDPRGVPLHFWQRELPNLRQAALTRKAIELMHEASSSAELGNIQQAQELYQEAAGLGPIEPKTAERIGAALDRLSLTNSFEPEEERKLVDSLHQLLDRVESEQSGLAMLLRSCAIPLWWDEPVLAAIRELDDGREQEILQKLEFFPFITRWPDHNVYTRFARPILLQKWQNKSDEFIVINRRILDYFESGWNAAREEHIARSERWELSRLYHLLLDNPDRGAEELMLCLRQIEEDYRSTKALRYVAVLKENQDYLPQEYCLPPEYRSYLTYSDGWVHTLRNRPRIAREIFEDMLKKDDILPKVRARIQRHLGIVLVELHEWSEAIDSYDRALAYFKEQQDIEEVAHTMERLGFAYMDIANHAYNHEDYFEADDSWTAEFWQTIGTISYLPLILYVLNNFKLGWNPRAWWRWGQDMDWVIAKYYAQAIQWFKQAEEVYEQLGDARGLNQVRSSLGALYLNLHYTNQAVDIFERLESEYADGTYQQAYIRLQLARALFEEGDDDRCEELLQKALTVFKSLEYTLRIAQTQTLLGKVATRNNKPDSAMQAYAEALEKWQAVDVGDEMMATTVIHNMEGLATQRVDPPNENWLSKLYHRFASRIHPQQESQPISQDSETLLGDAQQKIKDRVYESRFIHPLMRTFQRTAFTLLCFLAPLVLWFSIRTEADTNIGATAIQSLPAQQQLDEWKRFGLIIKEPEVSQMIQQYITPKFEPEFFSSITIGALLFYLVIYTAIGLFLLRKIKMSDVESLQAVKLRANGQRVSKFVDNQTLRLINWSKVKVFLTNNRSIFHRPIKFFSKTTLVTGQESQKIRGYTKGYTKAIEWIQHHLPEQVQKLETGFSLLYSVLGWLALSTIALLLAFIVMTFVDRSLLNKPFIFSTYAISDLYNILFLGLYIPLLYWFILQPLRGRLAHHVEYSQQLWFIACLALALSLIRFVQFEFSFLELNRPELFLAVTAILLGGFVLHQLYSIERSKLRSMKAIRTTIVAILSIGIALALTGRELASFHSLVNANNILYKIADDQKNRNEDADYTPEYKEEYEEALALYEDSHNIRQTAVTLNSQGNVYMQLREYEQAAEKYEEAIQQAPHMRAYQRNLALAYREWATYTNSREDFDEKIARYNLAIEEYDELIKKIEQEQQDYPYRNNTESQEEAYKLRATTRFDLAQTYYEQNDSGKQTSIEHFKLAKNDYEWMIENSHCSNSRTFEIFLSKFISSESSYYRSLFPQCANNEEQAAGRIGRGWSLRYLQSSKPENTPERRQFLDEAIREFEMAKEVSEEYASAAYNGIGWAHFAISQDTNIRGNCINGRFDNDRTKADYIHQIESALDAFTKGIAADQGNGYFYSTRAQLQYILGRCGKLYNKVDQDRRAILDYHEALKLDSSRSNWHYRLGMLYYAVGLNFDAKNIHHDKYKKWKQSAEVFLRIIATDPDYDADNEQSPLKRLQTLYNRIEGSNDGLAEDIIIALGVADTDESLIKAAQIRLDNKNHELAYFLLQRVINRTPDHKEALLMLARATYQFATQYDIHNQPRLYQEAIDVANRTLDAGIENVELYTILARSYADRDNEQEALVALQQAEPLLQADDPLHHYLQGAIYVSYGDAEAAKSAYGQGIQLMAPITNTSIAADVYAQAIGDVLLLPITKDSDEVQLKLAGEMAVLVAEAALEIQGVSYTNRDEAWNAAESARKNKEYKTAIPRYIKALTFAPDDYDIRLLLRNVLIHGYGMNNVTSGAAALIATLGVSEQYDVYEALMAIVDSELAQDTFGLAVVALDRAQVLKPNESAAFFQHANIYLRWAEKWPHVPNAPIRYQKAVDSAQQVLELDPTNLEALLILAHAYVGLDQADEAMVSVTEMLEENPDDIQAKLMQAHIEFKQANYEQALSTIQEILDQDDQYIPAYLTQIGIYHVNEEYQKAADAALQIIGIDPAHKDAHLALGRLYCKHLTEYEKSLAVYRKIIELEGLNYRTFWTMSWDSRYVNTSSVFMANGYVLGSLGRNAYENQEYELSAEASQNAIVLMPNEPLHYGYQGVAYVAMGDLDAARESYSGLIEIANRPENSEIWLKRLNNAIGHLYKINADPKDAAQQFIDMLEKERSK